MPPGKPGIAPVARYTPTPTRAAKGKGKATEGAVGLATAADEAGPSSAPVPADSVAPVVQASASTPITPSTTATASSSAPASLPPKPSDIEPTGKVKGKAKATSKGKGKAKAQSADVDREEGEISDGEPVVVHARTPRTAPTASPNQKGIVPPRPAVPGQTGHVASVSSYRPGPTIKAARPAQPAPAPAPKAVPAPAAARPPAVSVLSASIATPSAANAGEADDYDRENKYEYQFLHGQPPPKRGKRGKGKGKGKARAQGFAGGDARPGSRASTAGPSTTSSNQSEYTAEITKNTQVPTLASTELANGLRINESMSANMPVAGPSRLSQLSSAITNTNPMPALTIPLGPTDNTPDSLREYLDNLKVLLRSGITDQTLLERGVDQKHVSAVCHEIAWASQLRAQKKTDAELWTQPREKRELSDDASHGGLTPATLSRPTVEAGMDVDMDADEAADEYNKTGVSLHGKSTMDMLRSLSETTDSSEERQVERMMIVASPESTRSLPLASGPTGKSTDSQTSQRQPPPTHQPLRLSASSSWTPSPPTGPRLLQSKGSFVPTAVPASVSLPARLGASAQVPPAANAAVVGGDAKPVSGTGANSAAALKARLLAGKAASSPSTTSAVPLASAQSAPTPAAAPLNPLAVPFMAPATSVPTQSPAPIPAPASAPAKAPSRDLTAALQVRTAMLDARRKALESMKVKRQEVQHVMADVGAPASANAGTLQAAQDATPAITMDGADNADMSNSAAGSMEQVNAAEAELEDLKANLDTMVKEAAEMEVHQAEEIKQAADAPLRIPTQTDSDGQMDVDADPEEGEISDTTPPPTGALTPSAVTAPAAVPATATAPVNRRKRPNAMDFDNNPAHASGRSYPYKRRFGVAPLPIPILIAQEKRRLYFRLEDEDAGDDSSDDEEERNKRLGTGTPVPEIRIPDEYDPKKQILEHAEKIEQLKRLIAEKKMKADAKAMADRVKLRRAEAKAAAGAAAETDAEQGFVSELASAQMSRVISEAGQMDEVDGVVQVRDLEVENGETGEDMDVPNVINDQDQPKADQQDGEIATSSTSVYQPMLRRYPLLARPTTIISFSDSGSPSLDTGLLCYIALTRRLNAEPDLYVCAAEVGGGACADTGCEDLHLDRQLPITEDDLIQYASHHFPKHSTKVVRAAVKQIVKSTRESGATPHTMSRRKDATAKSGVQAQSEQERDGLMQALVQVVSLLSSLPPAGSTGSTGQAGAT